ncbi:MAG TPA: VWA domain-containing protein [Bryobacteraceae bacterium]|nr:VWA domain-containing protein [Bryobacteraceae bacterium]
MTRRTVLAGLAAAVSGTPRRLLAQSDPSFSVDVRMVEVYATVFDDHGRYVDGLGRDGFEIRDEGQPQPIVDFGGTSDPLACAMLLDTTGSMEKVLPQVRSSILDFIDKLGPLESIAIYTFDTGLRLRQEFTTDKLAARRAVMRTRAGGETALFDALAQTAHEIAKRKGKKVIVLFTDGGDNASALDAVSAENTVRKFGVPVYTIAEGEALESNSLIGTLRDIARKTGGTASVVRKPADVSAVFDEIAKALQHTYLLSYKAPAVSEHGWRNIQVALRQTGKYKIRAKQGYFPD